MDKKGAAGGAGNRLHYPFPEKGYEMNSMEGIIFVLTRDNGIKRKNYISGRLFALKLVEKKFLAMAGN